MPAHSERKILPYTPRQLYDMVIDIERYPDFLPWCRAARTWERKGDEFLGELVISFHHMSESYTSRVTGTPPQAGAPGAIDVTMVKGPFDYLVNRWRFTRYAMPDGGEGCEVDFFLDFKFRSRLLDKMLGGLFGKATAKMVAAFTDRARQLYGAKP